MADAPPTNLGYGSPSEATIDQVNVWMRSSPWYRQMLAAWGQDPNSVHLSDWQPQQVVRAAQAQGVVVDEGNMEVDPSGNFNPKGHKLRNTLIVAGLAGAAIATMGAAGVFGGATGLAGGGAGASGAGGAGAAGLGSGTLFAGTGAGATGAGLGATGGVLSGLPGAGTALGGISGGLGAATAPLAATQIGSGMTDLTAGAVPTGMVGGTVAGSTPFGTGGLAGAAGAASKWGDLVKAIPALAGVFDSVVTEGVTDAIRHTVAAVPEGAEVTMTGLQAKLAIAKSTVSWRVQRALKGGWLKNLEVRRGHPARLVLGEPMPDATTALPTVEQVRGVFESGLQEVIATKSTSYAEVFECSNGNLERPDGNKLVASAAACPAPESFEL